MNGKLKKALSLTLSAMLVLGATSVSAMAEDNSGVTEIQESENHVSSTLSTNIEEKDFYVGVPAVFTFTTTANDDAGTMVIGTSNFSDSDAIEKLEYYDARSGIWYDLKGDFGSSTGFPMSNATSKFRVTFKKTGNYSFTASMKTADGGNVLCSTKVDFEVKENLGAATVGDKTYDDFDSAVNAAYESTTDKTVKLIRNIETDDELGLIVFGGVSLDGDNHTITYTGTQAQGLNGGIITVSPLDGEKCTTNISNLTLKSDADANWGIVYNGGTSELSGTISNCTVNCPGAGYAISSFSTDLNVENSKLYSGINTYIYYYTTRKKAICKLSLSGIETEFPHKPDVEYNIVDGEWEHIHPIDYKWKPLVITNDELIDNIKAITGVESDAEAVKELNKYMTGIKLALYKNEDNGKVWAEELVETGRMKLNEESFDFDLNSDETTADVIIEKIENNVYYSGQVMRFDFTSSDENVVKVTDIGLTEYEDDFASIEAVGVGEAEITATAYANVDDVIGTVKCKVTVTDTAPTSVTLKNKEITLTSTGATFTLEPKIEHKKETDKITWTSSNENVATVDNNGVVTAVSEGTAVITVKVGEATDTCKVTVEYPEVVIPVESIKLNTEKVTLTSSGATFALEVNVEPENTTDKNITFTSSNEKVATVDSNGVITAVGEGEAVITVKIGDVTAEVKVVVSYNNGSSSSSKKEDESDSSSGSSSSGSTSGGGSGSSSGSTSGGGGGSSSKPAETVVGTVEAPENVEVNTEASSKATNEAASVSAKDTENIDLVSEEGTSVDSKDFTEPVILSVPVDVKDVNNVNNLTLAKFNAETGKLEIVGGVYNAETKAVAGYVNTSGDYFAVEKADLVTITLQIGNSDASLNNADKQLDAAPIISDDRTMVPVRFIAEAFGAEVNWIEDTKTVEIILGDKVLTMQIDKEIEGFGAAPVISNNRTMVPIRYISENFGANVIWIPSTQTIAIAK